MPKLYKTGVSFTTQQHRSKRKEKNITSMFVSLEMERRWSLIWNASSLVGVNTRAYSGRSSLSTPLLSSVPSSTSSLSASSSTSLASSSSSPASPSSSCSLTSSSSALLVSISSSFSALSSYTSSSST